MEEVSSVAERVGGCTDDWQHVRDYEDREGVDRSFIDEHEGPVAHRNGGCNGTLIGDGLLLTVRHSGCASSGSMYNMHTQLVVDGDPSQREDYKSIQVVENIADPDVAIMRLPFNPEYRWGAETISLTPPQVGDQIVIMGNPAGEQKVADVGTVRSMSSDGYNMGEGDIYSYHGLSGAGVLSTASGKLIGLHRAGPEPCPNPNGGKANAMQRVADFSEIIDSDEASARFYSTKSGGFGDFRSLNVHLSSAWRHIVRGDFNGDGLDDLLFYEASGLSRFYRTNSVPQIVGLGPQVTMRPGAAQLVALQLDGTGPEELYYYNPRPTEGNGLEAFYRTDGSGSLTEIRHQANLGWNWRLITAGDFASRPGPELLFYADTSYTDENEQLVTQGTFALYGTNTNGSRSHIGSTTVPYSNFSIIVPGQFSRRTVNGFDRDEIVAYDVFDRSVHFFSFDDSGTSSEIASLGGLPLITQITTGKFNTSAPDFRSQLMFYSPVTGDMSWYSVSEGSLSLLTTNNQRKSWGFLIAGHYRSTSTSDLMLYDRYRH